MFKQTCFILVLLWIATGWIACDRLSGMGSGEKHALQPENQPSPPYTNAVSIDLTLMDEHFHRDTVDILIPFDHVFKRPKRYRALPLLPVLEQIIDKHHLDTAVTTVYFLCKDGYMPTYPLSAMIKAGGGYLAFKDLDVASPKLWADSLAPSYSPYLLVWENMAPDEHSFPWPWGLTGIRLVENDQGLESLYPEDTPQLADAYALYRENCMKCHAINHIGGIMGPEFNYPKNITEYWSRDNIIAFAKAPTSFRSNSKMPAVQHLKEGELHRIVDYLEYIARRQ